MDELEVAILNLLVFPETFESIVDECPHPTTRHVAGDVLKKLMHDELVSPMYEDPPGTFTRSLGYDSDSLDTYRYQLTSKGLNLLTKMRIR